MINHKVKCMPMAQSSQYGVGANEEPLWKRKSTGSKMKPVRGQKKKGYQISKSDPLYKSWKKAYPFGKIQSVERSRYEFQKLVNLYWGHFMDWTYSIGADHIENNPNNYESLEEFTDWLIRNIERDDNSLAIYMGKEI